MKCQPLFRTCFVLTLLACYSFFLQSCKTRNRIKFIEIEQVKKVEKDTDPANNILIFDFFEDYASIRSKKALEETFGKKNCVNGRSTYAQGAIKVKHTIIFNTQNNHVVKYVWNKKDSKKLDFIEASHLIYDNKHNIIVSQKIDSECGMSLGMQMDELAAWNKKDFEFAGFGWDSEGIVHPSDFSNLDQCKVKIALGLDKKVNKDPYLSLFGEQMIKSSDDLVKKAPIFVSTFTMYISK